MILHEKLHRRALIHALRLASLWVLSALGPGCGSPATPSTQPSSYEAAKSRPPRAGSAPLAANPGESKVSWALDTRAPVPARAEVTASLALPCRADGALESAARRILADPNWERDAKLEPSFVRWATRASGSPYVRPQAARFSAGSRAALDAAVARFASNLTPSDVRRCGISEIAEHDGRQQLAVVIADGPATLAPLPTRVARGEPIGLRAELVEPATRVELTVLGPDGQPHARLVESEGDAVATRFALYERGKHVVQLLADLPGGPEPVLEAWIFVDADPYGPEKEHIPGEGWAGSNLSPERQLFLMANDARRTVGLAPLTVDPRLASLAQQHAQAMRDRGELEHDLGDGDPVVRIEALGLSPRAAGENLARATSVMGAHRAIWESPAHRSNLLSAHYDAIGIGLSRDERGVLWVCQLFADYR